MAAEIITTDDLREFKMEMLQEIKSLLQSTNNTPTKKWLKSSEVRKLLGISTGTLQTFRINGTLPYSKIGGIILYSYEEIQKVILDNRIDHF